MTKFQVTIKERDGHVIHTSYIGPDTTTIDTVIEFFGLKNADVDSYDVNEVAILDDKQPELHPTVKQYLDMKSKHPDAVLLFRIGDFYESYCTDAQTLASVCGITLTRRLLIKEPDGKGLRIAGFPYHALDTYLPKLIRAGKRVAICDQIETPTKTTKK